MGKVPLHAVHAASGHAWRAATIILILQKSNRVPRRQTNFLRSHRLLSLRKQPWVLEPNFQPGFPSELPTQPGVCISSFLHVTLTLCSSSFKELPPGTISGDMEAESPLWEEILVPSYSLKLFTMARVGRGEVGREGHRGQLTVCTDAFLPSGKTKW